jgi:hypothetical protein
MRKQRYFYLEEWYKFWLNLGLCSNRNTFESKISTIKNMKFAVASIVALAAFFSQVLAAEVQHCASSVVLYRFNNRADNMYFLGGGPHVRPC